MKSVGLIIAKKDSERLKNKNFLDFCGKPMFVWNLEKMLKIFDKVYVSSDYDFILETAKNLGAIPIKRPSDLCGDAPSILVFKHAFKFMDNPEIIVSVQANSPTIEESLIKRAKELMERDLYNELATCRSDLKPYYSVWGIAKEKLLSYENPLDRTPKIFLVDDSVDIHTKEDLEEAFKQTIKQN
jgi:CMP-N-acetylneuraminic acid synthetase